MTALCGAVMKKSCQADADGYVPLSSEAHRLYKTEQLRVRRRMSHRCWKLRSCLVSRENDLRVKK